jgi:hypothetical protein
VQIIGVAWSGTEESMQAFVDRHRLTFLQINDEAGAVYARFGVPYQPAWVFVDRSGVVERVQGAVGDDELAARLDGLAQS